MKITVSAPLLAPLVYSGSGCGRKSSKVRLELNDPLASEVWVVGSFNRWEPMPLKKNDGHWAVDLQLAPGHYEYQFIVDGEWMADPSAGHSVLNPLGGRNSVLYVADETER